MRALLAVLLASAAGMAAAQSVSMSGKLGDKALLIINGKARTLAAGGSFDGVKVVSVSADESVVEVDGKRFAVRLGGAQVNLGGSNSEGGGSTIVLHAGSGGHFSAGGTINGKQVKFVVDTGATSIAISQSEADSIGLAYKQGQRGMAQTANGPVVMHRVMLGAVRINDVTIYNVEAVVIPASMPFVLLGNSFLTRFQMKRENDVMTLVKRP